MLALLGSSIGFYATIECTMSKQHDFTHGSILKQLVVFSAPIMATNLLQVSYHFVDSLWVGNLLGANALGAVAIASMVIFTVLSFIFGLNNAALTILSQQKGLQDNQGLKAYLNAFVVILTLMALTLSVSGTVLTKPLLLLMDTPTEILADAGDYLRINFLGVLFLLGYNFIGTVLRAMGDSRTPIRFVMLAVVLNMVLDPLFIYVFGWGIKGAAWATIASQGCAFFYGLIFVLRRRLAPFSWPFLPSWQQVRLILHLGIPAGLQMAVIAAGIAAIMSVVAGFGEAAVAGYGAAQRLDSLLLLPAQALGAAVTSMAGQNMGTGNIQRVNKIAKLGVFYSFSIMLLLGILLLFLAEFGIRLFIQAPEAVAFGALYLQTVALCYPFLGINFLLNGVVRSSGAMYPILALNIISFWVLRFPLTALMSDLMGEVGIGVGISLSFVISSLVAFLYFAFGNWRHKKLFAGNH